LRDGICASKPEPTLTMTRFSLAGSHGSFLSGALFRGALLCEQLFGPRPEVWQRTRRCALRAADAVPLIEVEGDAC